MLNLRQQGLLFALCTEVIALSQVRMRFQHRELDPADQLMAAVAPENHCIEQDPKLHVLSLAQRDGNEDYLAYEKAEQPMRARA